MIIRHFIFDMGNVLIEYCPEQIMRAIVGREELFDEVMSFTTHSPVWQELDRGAVTQEEAVDSMVAKAPHIKQEVEAVMARWDEALRPLPGMLELVAELKKKGYGLHLLSNASLRFHAYENRFPVLRLMDSIHVSADMKMLKPDREIFDAVLANQRLAPQECLFIDDLPQNIKGAREAGLNAYQFKTPEAFQAYLISEKLL